MTMSWEPPSSSSSFAFEEKNQEMMTSSVTLQKKNKELTTSQGCSPSFATHEKKKQMTTSQGGSLSFATSGKKNKQMRTSLMVRRHLLNLRKKIKK
jgi:hypothetical protein